MAKDMTRVLFVCLGNICRSPSAEALFRSECRRRGLAYAHDSAGTGAWHVGEAPYAPMQKAALARGIDMSDLRARQVRTSDFYEFDLIIGMDASNMSDLEHLVPADAVTKIRHMGSFLPKTQTDNKDVPDPYYTRNFDATLDILEDAMPVLFAYLEQIAA